MQIHPKVTSGTAGVGLGGFLTIILFWIFEGAGMSPDAFTADRIAAVTAVMSAIVGFVAGYMTSSPPPEPPPAKE